MLWRVISLFALGMEHWGRPQYRCRSGEGGGKHQLGSKLQDKTVCLFVFVNDIWRLHTGQKPLKVFSCDISWLWNFFVQCQYLVKSFFFTKRSKFKIKIKNILFDKISTIPNFPKEKLIRYGTNRFYFSWKLWTLAV